MTEIEIKARVADAEATERRVRAFAASRARLKNWTLTGSSRIARQWRVHKGAYPRRGRKGDGHL
jgi:hypothetical protein